ncbi:hypothetical protein GCM10027446_16770 [Angustibacter peucedani]
MSGFTSRLPWAQLPAAVVAAVQHVVRADVRQARDVHGGMSPGPAAVLSLDDGREVFAKVSTREVNERSYQLYADEIAAYRAIEALTTLPRPTLLGTVMIGPWIGLVLTVAPGRSAGPPWRAGAVAPVVRAVEQVAAHRAPPGLPPALDRLPDLDGWAVLANDPSAPLDPRDQALAPRCAALVEGWRSWTVGDALVHHDCRCDNALVDDDGLATLVDWNFACAGAAWLDVALLACDVVGSGVDDPAADPVAAALELLAPLPADASRFAVAMAGMMRRNSLLPAHSGLPTFRPWQAARADRLRPLVEALVPALA